MNETNITFSHPNLLLVLIKNTLKGATDVKSLFEETRIPVNVIETMVNSLARNGFVSYINKKYLKTSEKQRLGLAVLALNQGIDVEIVCKDLGWKEFEDLAALALHQNDFEVKKHFRFKRVAKRYEIDVIGLREPFMLSIECKHWRRSYGKVAIVKAVKMQVERTKALIQSLPDPKDRLRIGSWKEVKCIPIVLTLLRTSLKIYDGIPVVPIFQFNRFLYEIQTHLDYLLILSQIKPITIF